MRSLRPCSLDKGVFYKGGGAPPPPLATSGMPCTQCAHSAKFWMSANTRTLATFWW